MKWCIGTLLLFCSLLLKGQAQPVITADTAVIRLGEQIELTFSLQYRAKNKNESIKWPVIPDSLPGKIFVASRTELDTIPVEKNDPLHTLRKQKLWITAFDSGSYTVGPFAVVINGDSVYTNDLDFVVKTFAVDTTKTFKDIKDVVDVPFNLLDWLAENKYWVLGVAAVLAVVYTVISVVRRRKKKTEEIPLSPEPLLPPHEIALTRLRQLQQEKSWLRTDTKYYFSEVTNIVRDYIEKRYKVAALEHTTSETLYNLRFTDCPDEEKSRLNELLSTADLVKFAKLAPDEFISAKAVEHAISFVEQTKLTGEEAGPNHAEELQ